jgi:fibronectin-binding autotransporter adhesin
MANGNSLVILAVAGNSFGGVRVDTGGTIRTDVANAWNSSANMVLGTSESSSYINRFDLNGNSQTVASLTSANDAVVTNTITSASAATLTVNGSTNTTYNGTITGAVSLVKEGSSRLTLGGNNTYTGATTINGGTLLATNLQSSSGVTVNSGGSIGAGNALAACRT